jgi:hypothetical protein
VELESLRQGGQKKELQGLLSGVLRFKDKLTRITASLRVRATMIPENFFLCFYLYLSTGYKTVFFVESTLRP